MTELGHNIFYKTALSSSEGLMSLAPAQADQSSLFAC